MHSLKRGCILSWWLLLPFCVISPVDPHHTVLITSLTPPWFTNFTIIFCAYQLDSPLLLHVVANWKVISCEKNDTLLVMLIGMEREGKRETKGKQATQKLTKGRWLKIIKSKWQDPLGLRGSQRSELDKQEIELEEGVIRRDTLL